MAFSACDDLFEPAVENFKQPSDLENMPSWAVGLLGHAYIGNPLGENANNWSFTEVATDDAVSNDVNNGYRKMAAGAWRSDNTPGDLNRWQNLRASWQYLNQFLEISEMWNGPKILKLPNCLKCVFREMHTECVLSICIIVAELFGLGG